MSVLPSRSLGGEIPRAVGRSTGLRQSGAAARGAAARDKGGVQAAWKAGTRAWIGFAKSMPVTIATKNTSPEEPP
jgi:hypothetical protein